MSSCPFDADETAVRGRDEGRAEAQGYASLPLFERKSMGSEALGVRSSRTIE